MTLLPAESQRIKFVPEDLLKALPDYELPNQCAHPECDKAREYGGGHHVVRRSHTQAKGPQSWIAFDGRPFPNLIGLCGKHHRLITENRARIVYDDHQRFCWADLQGGFTAPLSPVPLIESSSGGLTAEAGAALDERGQEGEMSRDGREPSPRSPSSEEGSPAAQVVGASYGASVAPPSSELVLSPKPGVGAAALAPGAPCPGCGRKLPKPKAEQEEARPKQTWSIKVPVDARENGYALLRDLVEQCQHDLGREGEPPYYCLIEVMYAFLTSKKERAAA